MRCATVTTCRGLGSAHVLAASLTEHEPAARLTCLLADARPGEVAGSHPFDVLVPEDLGLPPGEVERIGAAHGPVGQAVALSAPLLRRLLPDEAGPIVLLGPDTELVASLAPFTAGLDAAPVVLAPALRAPADPDVERRLCVSGTLDAGLVAVGPDAGPFLDWWAARTARSSVASPPAGLYRERRWLDLAPQLFGARRARGMGRLLAGSPPWEPDLQALASDGAGVLAMGWGRPEDTDVAPPAGGAQAAALRAARAAYLRRVRAAEPPDARRGDRWRRTPGGLRIDHTMRRVYRQALVAGEAGVAPMPPNPFLDEEGFRAWMAEPPDRRGSAIRIARYLWELRVERPELRTRFPDLAGADAERLLLHVDVHYDDVPAQLRTSGLEPAPRPPDDPRLLRPGVNLAGPGPGAPGPPGELARALARALAGAGVPVDAVAWAPGAREATGVADAAGADHLVTVAQVEAADLADFDADVGVLLRPWRRQAAVWRVPPRDDPAVRAGAALADEVWAVGAAVAEAARALGVGEVVELPLALEPARGGDRSALGTRHGLPETAFLAGVLCDLTAEPGRDAAVAGGRDAIEAAGGAGVALAVVALRPRTGALEELEALHGWAQDAGGAVAVVETPGPRDEVRALLASCDVVLAPRAAPPTGTDTALLDVAAAGVPVVAAVGALADPAGAVAALADPAELGDVLARLAADPPALATRARAVAEDLLQRHGTDALQRVVAARLAELEASGAVPVGPAPDPQAAEADRRRRMGG